MSDLVKIAGGWIGTTKNGDPYTSYQIDRQNAAKAIEAFSNPDGFKLMAFRVKKKIENGPDVELFAAPKQARQAPTQQQPSSDDISF